jgi:hypothetical protein
MKANSYCRRCANWSSFMFSSRCTPLITSAIWCTGRLMLRSGFGATSTGQLSEPISIGLRPMIHCAAGTPMPGQPRT